MLIDHQIGLLLGAEKDWPRAFVEILSKVGTIRAGEAEHAFHAEPLRIHPFELTDDVSSDLVIDRLAHWYFHPREWLKKAALVNGTYLLNSPFTFQSMEKHSAYAAMIRLGLKVPRTVLLPYKHPVQNQRWGYTSATWNDPFDLDAIAADLGYPCYMKPFDGGGWRGVSRINNPEDLHRAYDESADMLMHLQATVDYDVFARALSIGPETMVMDFQPDNPMHARYAVSHGFLSDWAGAEVVTISRMVNAFFGWEFNSAEMLVKGDDVYPIDYANACPDVALTSLHYYFPWAITALVKWSVFCLVTGRKFTVDLQTSKWFEIADNPELDYGEKLGAYRKLADKHLAEDDYLEFCARHLSHLDEAVKEWVGSAGFDALLVDVVRETYPPSEHERFLGHFRGLVDLWETDQG